MLNIILLVLDKLFKKARRQVVQSAMLEEMGLIITQSRPGGAGSSNDGNTARRAFFGLREVFACALTESRPS